MPEQFNTIDASGLKQWLDQGKDVVVFDVLPTDSYEAQHVPGSISAPLTQGDFLEIVAKHVESKTTPVVVYCASASCQLSPKAAQTLAESGYTEVYDFEDGLAGWKEAEYSLESKQDEV